MRFLKEIDEDTRNVSPEFTANREISEAIEICEEAAYSDGEKLVYDKYWDTISRERTLIYCKLEKGRAEGLVEGEAIGIAKGKAEERRILALNLLNNGFSAEQTAKLTGLPIEAVTLTPCQYYSPMLKHRATEGTGLRHFYTVGKHDKAQPYFHLSCIALHNHLRIIIEYSLKKLREFNIFHVYLRTDFKII